MSIDSREKDIKLLVSKFVKLVESLNPGERLSITKLPAPKSLKASGTAKLAGKGKSKSTPKRGRKRA